VYNYNDTGGGHNLDWYIGFQKIVSLSYGFQKIAKVIDVTV